jgi:hypothetical protein
MEAAIPVLFADARRLSAKKSKEKAFASGIFFSLDDDDSYNKKTLCFFVKV